MSLWHNKCYGSSGWDPICARRIARTPFNTESCFSRDSENISASGRVSNVLHLKTSPEGALPYLYKYCEDDPVAFNFALNSALLSDLAHMVTGVLRAFLEHFRKCVGFVYFLGLQFILFLFISFLVLILFGSCVFVGHQFAYFLSWLRFALFFHLILI